MADSIFHAAVSGENAYTRLLCNLMNRDMVFRRILVARFLQLDADQVADSGVEVIPQRRLPDACGQPDLRIESPEACVIVEIKTDAHRSSTSKQELSDGKTYLSYLHGQVKAGKRAVLVFLVPHNWKFRRKLRNSIAALKKRGDATSVLVAPVYWEDVLQLVSDGRIKYETVFPEELRLLLVEHFGPISFEREEIESMFSSEFPIRTIVKMSAVLFGLKQKVPKRNAGELTSETKDEFGFYLKKGKRDLLFIGSWVAFWEANHRYPLCFGVQDDDPKIKEAFISALRIEYESEAISFDGWSMGGVPAEDFISVDAVDEIWSRIEPIWNSVRDAAH